MDIDHNKSESRGTFTASEDGKNAGKMNYSRKGENIVIEHTEVNPEFQGKGVGKKLVQGAVDYARESKIKIVPQCSYAKKVMERSSEFKDVIA